MSTCSWDFRLLIHKGNGFTTSFGEEIIKSSQLFRMKTKKDMIYFFYINIHDIVAWAWKTFKTQGSCHKKNKICIKMKAKI